MRHLCRREGRGLIAIAPLIALALAGAAPSVRSGIEAWQKRDYATALANWRPLAEKGDADAAFNLGQAYRLGRGVPINLTAAQTWLERAARKGHVDARTTLGLLLWNNGNRVSALRWLRMAADAGEPRAALLVGTALFNGDGTPRDPVLGYAYVSRAAAEGFGPAKVTLTEMDTILPVEDRQKGVKLALAKVSPVPAPAGKAPPAKVSAPAKAAAPAKVAQAKPVMPARAAAPSPPTTGGWRVQLGAFSQRSSADALFARLAAGPLAGKQKYLISAGKVTRLQAGPYASRAAANAACQSLGARGQACFPVPSR